MRNDLSKLIELMSEMVLEQRQMNSFLIQIVAHNADLLEQGDGDDEPEFDLSGHPIS